MGERPYPRGKDQPEPDRRDAAVQLPGKEQIAAAEQRFLKARDAWLREREARGDAK